MTTKQEPRPAYHRRMDVERLRARIGALPLLVVDTGDAYEIRLQPGEESSIPPGHEAVLQRGRYEVVSAYLLGWTHARALSEP